MATMLVFLSLHGFATALATDITISSTLIAYIFSLDL